MVVGSLRRARASRRRETRRTDTTRRAPRARRRVHRGRFGHQQRQDPQRSERIVPLHARDDDRLQDGLLPGAQIVAGVRSLHHQPMRSVRGRGRNLQDQHGQLIRPAWRQRHQLGHVRHSPDPRAGTSIIAEVSKDSGATFSPDRTWTGMSTADVWALSSRETRRDSTRS
jgi:hypothetical protein